MRLLYHLSLTGGEKRILVVGTPDQAGLAFERPRGEQRVAGRQIECLLRGSRWPAPPRADLDVVAFPGTLLADLADDGAQAPGPSPQALLTAALCALRPGGTVVGHLAQTFSLREWPRFWRSPARWQRWAMVSPFASAMRCQRSLTRLGFIEPACFFVEPRVSSPMALVPAEAAAARSHFVRTVNRNRPLYSGSGYALRMALAQLGLGGMLQQDLFFWARKPC